jgi:alanine racemase
VRRSVKAFCSRKAIIHNYRLIQGQAPNSALVPVIKANGYGYGAAWVVKALSGENIPFFAVATVDDQWALQVRARVVLHLQAQVDWLKQAHLSEPIEIWLKINTGMNRLGVEPVHFPSILAQLKALQQQNPLVLMTHLAVADSSVELTQKQLVLFSQITQGLPYPKSVANSAAIFQVPASHADWNRTGIMLYGSSPFMHQSALSCGLQVVMRLVCYVISLRTIEQGQCVGYGFTWCAADTTEVAIIGAGYADGFPRHIVDGFVWLRNTRAPIIGRVSMDMIAIDVTHIDTVLLGDEVELWGEHISVDEVAQKAGTLSYELFCQLTLRVERIDHE